MNVEHAQEVAEVGKMLSDETRVLIMASLAKGPRTVVALCRELKVVQPVMSSHLALLRMAGLVRRTPKGRERHYSLNREKLVVMTRFLVGAKSGDSAPTGSYRMNLEQAQDIAQVGRTLSDATRVLVVASLAEGPKAVGALSDELKVLQPVLSYHLVVCPGNTFT